LRRYEGADPPAEQRIRATRCDVTIEAAIDVGRSDQRAILVARYLDNRGWPQVAAFA
jgi:hypothetical protein